MKDETNASNTRVSHKSNVAFSSLLAGTWSYEPRSIDRTKLASEGWTGSKCSELIRNERQSYRFRPFYCINEGRLSSKKVEEPKFTITLWGYPKARQYPLLMTVIKLAQRETYISKKEQRLHLQMIFRPLCPWILLNLLIYLPTERNCQYPPIPVLGPSAWPK